MGAMVRLNRKVGTAIDRLLGHLGLGLAIGLSTPVLATEPAGAGERMLAIGVFAHDRGFASDDHKNGVDLECCLRPSTPLHRPPGRRSQGLRLIDAVPRPK
jgi:hypothetical protein